MTSPVASISHPAQIPALNAPHKDTQGTKKTKDKKKDAVSAYPLEVCLLPAYCQVIPSCSSSWILVRNTSTTVSKSSRS